MIQKPLPLAFDLLFWIAFVVSIYAKITSNYPLDNIVVPFLTISLIACYALMGGKENILYFSFMFCLIGDLMVMSDNFFYFSSGLTSYWGACVLFNSALYREKKTSLYTLLRIPKMVLPFAIYLIYLVLLMSSIQSYLGDLFIPILVYAATLSFTCALSFVVYLEEKTRGRLYLCIAMFSLSIAGSLIGLNRFYFDHDSYRVFETLFYSPTLYLIFIYFKKRIKYAI